MKLSFICGGHLMHHLLVLGHVEYGTGSASMGAELRDGKSRVATPERQLQVICEIFSKHVGNRKSAMVRKSIIVLPLHLISEQSRQKSPMAFMLKDHEKRSRWLAESALPVPDHPLR